MTLLALQGAMLRRLPNRVRRAESWGNDQHMSGNEEELAVDHSDGSETRLPAAFFYALMESRSAEPTQALVDAARRLRAVVQRPWATRSTRTIRRSSSIAFTIR